MAENLSVSAPDFDRIRVEAGVLTENAIRTIWTVLNGEIGSRQRHRVHWQDVAYASVTFSASAGTWTVASGDFLSYKFMQLGDLMAIQWDFATTTTSAGMGTQLRFTLPGNVKGSNAASSAPFTGFVSIAASAINEIGIAILDTSPNQNRVILQRTAAGSWPSSETDTLTVRGLMLLQTA